MAFNPFGVNSQTTLGYGGFGGPVTGAGPVAQASDTSGISPPAPQFSTTQAGQALANFSAGFGQLPQGTQGPANWGGVQQSLDPSKLIQNPTFTNTGPSVAYDSFGGGATNPSYGTSPFATPDGSQAGTDFLNYRASQTPWFTMGANGQAQWNMPTANNLGMGPTPPVAPSGLMGGFDAGASNPNLTSQADDIQRRVQQMMGQTMAGIQGDSVGVGGLGGARQGVAQGIATSQGMDNLAGQLANLFGGAWENQQNRGLQQYGMGLNYNLGARGQDIQSQLGNRNIDLNRYLGDQNFYTAQRGQDQSGAALGANLWNLGINGAWAPINNANNVYGNYTGFGTTNGTQQTGGGWPGVIGGALGGAQIGKLAGWWG